MYILQLHRGSPGQAIGRILLAFHITLPLLAFHVRLVARAGLDNEDSLALPGSRSETCQVDGRQVKADFWQPAGRLADPRSDAFGQVRIVCLVTIRSLG